MVVSTVAGIGLAVGLIAIAAGVALHRYVLPVMAHAVQTGLPPAVLDVYRASELILLALSGLAIAWQARSPGQLGSRGPHRIRAPHRITPTRTTARPNRRADEQCMPQA
jgi:hypothetical protein